MGGISVEGLLSFSPFSFSCSFSSGWLVVTVVPLVGVVKLAYFESCV